MTDVARAERLHALGVAGVVFLWVPILLWIVHLGTLAALAPYIANEPSKWWLWWVDTGVCAGLTIACILGGIALGVRMNEPEDAGNPEGRNRFIGWHVVLAGLANLALILAEGSLFLFLSPLHR